MNARNHLPGELAAQLLERDAATKRYVVMPTVEVPVGAAATAGERDSCESLAEVLNDGRCDLPLIAPPIDQRWPWAVVDLETVPAPEKLTAAQRELLANMAEECAEVIQRVTKILRFGLRRNPYNGEHNRDCLEHELGDVFAMTELLHRHDVIDAERVSTARYRKIEALARNEAGRLRYASVEP